MLLVLIFTQQTGSNCIKKHALRGKLIKLDALMLWIKCICNPVCCFCHLWWLPWWWNRWSEQLLEKKPPHLSWSWCWTRLGINKEVPRGQSCRLEAVIPLHTAYQKVVLPWWAHRSAESNHRGESGGNTTPTQNLYCGSNSISHVLGFFLEYGPSSTWNVINQEGGHAISLQSPHTPVLNWEREKFIFTVSEVIPKRRIGANTTT